MKAVLVNVACTLFGCINGPIIVIFWLLRFVVQCVLGGIAGMLMIMTLFCFVGSVCRPHDMHSLANVAGFGAETAIAMFAYFAIIHPFQTFGDPFAARRARRQQAQLDSIAMIRLPDRSASRVRF